MLLRERPCTSTPLPVPAPLPSLTAALSRRAALFGAVTLPALAASGTVISVSSADDSAAITAAGELKALRAREVAAWAALPEDHPDDFPPYVACGALADEVREGGEALALLPATSAAALRAKAEAMLALFGPSTWTEQEAVTEHHLLVVSVVRDAARLGLAGATDA